MRVVVDRDLCQDHGQCVFAAPEVFRIDEGGRLVVLVERPDDASRAECEEAALVCPKQAISIED